MITIKKVKNIKNGTLPIYVYIHKNYKTNPTKKHPMYSREYN